MGCTGHFDTILSFIPKKGFEIQYYFWFLDMLLVRQVKCV